MLNDAVIDHWADIYRACGLRSEISFELFLSDPWRYLRGFGQETAPGLIEQGWRPLLPAQARVARELAIADRWAERVATAAAAKANTQPVRVDRQIQVRIAYMRRDNEPRPCRPR